MAAYHNNAHHASRVHHMSLMPQMRSMHRVQIVRSALYNM